MNYKKNIGIKSGEEIGSVIKSPFMTKTGKLNIMKINELNEE